MFCSKCNENVKDVALVILKHLRDFHQDEKDLNVPCPECPLAFSSEPTFRLHYYSVHHVKKRKIITEDTCRVKKVCAVGADRQCSEQVLVDPLQPPVVEARVESEVIQDQAECSKTVESLSEDHPPNVEANVESEAIHVQECSENVQTDNLSSVDSEVDKCAQECSTNVKSLRNEETSTVGSSDENLDSESDDSSDSESEGESVSIIHEKYSVKPSSSGSYGRDVNPDAASFLLHLKEKCVVPDSSLKDVLLNTESLISSTLKDFSNLASEKLKDKNLSLGDVMNVDSVINETTAKVFDNLRSVTAQNKYFKENLGVVEPLRIPIAREFKRVRKSKKGIISTKIIAEEIVYVPVEDAVDKLIGHPDYKRFVEEKSTSSNSTVLDSYMKGTNSARNAVLREHPDALRFILYYDDLEVCSPLKSKAVKNKIGAFYLHLDNIPLQYRSNLDVIIVVALVNAELIKGKRYGMDFGLEEIVKVLKKFEDGIILKSGKKVYGTLIATIGDNLGAHQVGGFKEGFTATRGCRFCFATSQEIRKMTSENADLLRDKVTHARQCAEVQTVRGKNETKSTEYGVNRDSLLNTLQTYHVIGGMPPDFLHDMWEGLLPLTVKKFLRYHLYETKEEKKFTLEWLNSAIRDFDYGYTEMADKPSELKKDIIMDDTTRLHQSGCQMLLLATVLPLILGPIMDVEDKHFKNVLDALEISRIILSTEISLWMLGYLKDLIEEYLTDFLSLYGSLIPKLHHLLHYPTQILLFGPLVNFMCLRSEAKHKYFTRLVNMLGSFKNIPWTLGCRHQLSQAAAWEKSLIKEAKCGPYVYLSTEDLHYKSLLPSLISKVVQTNWLQLGGIKYVPEQCYICVGVNSSNSHPIFVKVLKVLIYPVIQFVCQKVCTKKKNIHLAAYEIDDLSELCLVKPDCMLIPKVYHAHSVQQKKYVAVRQCVADALF